MSSSSSNSMMVILLSSRYWLVVQSIEKKQTRVTSPEPVYVRTDTQCTLTEAFSVLAPAKAFKSHEFSAAV